MHRLSAALADRYQIERELGAGGMATVYLAHDVRHDRRVALKVLRPELSAILGAGRFLAEIKTTANLQHPHILSLFDSGEADGLVFYVMPYVEGESLRDRITREKQLPVDDAVRIAREVADALDYAHGHGVVHRDIKPENILLHGGHAMVADFGIALAASKSEGGTRMTETGMSLGTPHYMSPEQAMGEREITPKADIYALGCVLYEMLTGEPPFTGPTPQAIVARVMTEQPRSLTLQRHTIPPHVEAAVSMALEKLPADRFVTAAEFGEALSRPGVVTRTAAAPAPGAPARASLGWQAAGRRGAPWLVAVVASGVAVWSLARREPPRPVSRYELELPAAQAPLVERAFAISPDGSHLVYVGPGPDGPQLWVKARDRSDAVPLVGTTSTTSFTVSPDGEWLAFVQAGQLKKIPFVGGAAITLADSAAGSGLAWLDDGGIVYAAPGARELRRVPGVGGPFTSVWRPDSTDSRAIVGRFPTPLPGGRGVLFSRCTGGACNPEQDLWALDLGSGRARRVVTGAAMGWYLPTGQLIYVRRDGGMFAVPFSVRGLTTSGNPVPVLDSISLVNDVIPLVAIGSDGTLVVRLGASLSSRRRYLMTWVDRAGRASPIDSTWAFRLTEFGGNSGWALSPDGRRLAIGLATDAGDDVWIKELPRGPLSRLTFDSMPEFRPRWMPDGRSVLYVKYDGTVGGGLFRRRADGTGTEEPVLRLSQGIYEGLWSADARWLVLRTGGTLGQTGGRDIFAMQPATDSAPAPLMVTPYDEAAIALSPDGRWLAHESNETGRTEVYLRPFPDIQAGKWQVSVNGGVAPLWSRNGRELYFVNGDRDMVVTSVTAGPQVPELGERRVLFRLANDLYLADHENYTPYDVGPDGRFLMARRVQSDALRAAPLVVTENWFAELRQRLGRR